MSEAGRFFRLRVFVVASAVPLLMRLPLERLAKLLEPRRVPPEPNEAAIDALVERIDRVVCSGRRPLRNTCLTRGITRYWFLRRAGVDVRLAFGMGQPDGPTFSGHCWLVRHGLPYLERRDPAHVFVELYSVPPAHDAAA